MNAFTLWSLGHEMNDSSLITSEGSLKLLGTGELYSDSMLKIYVAK